MTLTLWRVVKHRYRDEALSGEGSRLHGGRWSSSGQPVIYCSQHLSLAILEILVHTQRVQMMSAYDQVSIQLTPEQVVRMSLSDLPPNWRDPFPGNDLQRVGDDWLASGKSLALEVPSVVLPQEFNYLINPLHEEFKEVRTSLPETIRLDPRLFLGSQ